jgi:hypothetical protein
MLGRPQRRKVVTYFMGQCVVTVEQQANFYRYFDYISHLITARPELEPDPTEPIFTTLCVCCSFSIYVWHKNTPC